MKSNGKPKILFLGQLPPPVHGSAAMNQYIHESSLIQETFEASWIDISLGESLETIGKFGLSKIWVYIKIHLKLLSKLLYSKYDVAYFTIAPYGIPFFKDSLLVIWLKLFHVKRIFHMHGKGVDEEIKTSDLKKKYYNFIFSNSSVIHLSESLLSDLNEVKSIKRRFALPNGIQGYNPDLKKNKFFDFLYLSNFFETKGALELLMIAKILVDNQLDFHLRLAGGWSDSRFKKKLLNYYESVDWQGKVEITGPLYGESKHDMFRGSDILVFPSNYRMECFPLVILEAMSCGLVVVATNVGAIPEILEYGESGILIEPGNIQGSASAIMELLRDNDRLVNLSKRGRENFEKKYSLKVFEDHFIRILKEIISDKNS